MYASKFRKLIFLVPFLLLNVGFCNMDVSTPDDREIERTQRIDLSTQNPIVKKATTKTKKQQMQDLENYEKTLEKKDWDSIKKRSSCLQKKEKEQFERVLDGLKGGNVFSGIFGIGKAMWHELIGNQCKEENPLTPRAQNYMEMLNNIMIDKYRDKKNLRHEVH